MLLFNKALVVVYECLQHFECTEFVCKCNFQSAIVKSRILRYHIVI